MPTKTATNSDKKTERSLHVRLSLTFEGYKNKKIGSYIYIINATDLHITAQGTTAKAARKSLQWQYDELVKNLARVGEEVPENYMESLGLKAHWSDTSESCAFSNNPLGPNEWELRSKLRSE